MGIDVTCAGKNIVISNKMNIRFLPLNLKRAIPYPINEFIVKDITTEQAAISILLIIGV